MSTAQLYLLADTGSQANFQNWAQGISLQLDAMGWTKTSDTGQVNWSTNPAVPANNTWTLYEIRVPASDSLQTGATAYYIRIDYGTRTSPYPGIRITLGTATNGAGTLTGIVTTPVAMGQTGGTAGASTPYECDFSWDASRVGAMLWRNWGTGPIFFAIERTKATSGADNSDGVSLICASSGAGQSQQTLVFGIGVSPALPILATIYAAQGNSLSFNNSVPVSPIFPCYGKWGNPMTVAGGIESPDAVEGAFLTTTLYGSTRTYLMTKGLSPFGNTTNLSLMQRFD